MVRTTLKNMVNDNSLTIEDIWKNFEYAKKHVPDLLVGFVTDEFSYEISDDPETWDRDYFFTASASLDTNFSEKRFDNVLKARDHLRKQGDPDFKYIKATHSR